MNRRLWLLPLLAAVAVRAQTPIPAIGSIGDEETVANLYMERPAVAADSKGQPHFVCDAGGDTHFMKYHRVNGQWSGGVFAVGARGGRYDASRLYIGQIEIDAKDRAWVSCKFGVKEYGSMYGQGIWLFRNVSTAPAEQFFRFVCVYKGMGVITTDVKYPDQGVVIGTFGNYAVLNTSAQTLSSGSLNGGPGGEKVRARIASYAPRFSAVPAGTPDGLWHTAMNGYSAASSRYQNSARYKAGQGPVEWAAYSAYPSQGSDFSHPGLGVDLVNPQICYIGSVFNGRLCLNIWNGSRMLYPSTSLKVLDYGATYEVRHGPSFAPAPSGGTFIFWTAGGRIKSAFITPEGESTEPVDITAGRSPAVTTDRFGDLHLVYSSGGPRYRKLTLGAVNPLAPAGRIAGDRRPVFTWSGAASPVYTLALSRDGQLITTATAETNAWQPDDDLAPGAYSWIVRAGAEGGDEPWSRPLAFIIPPAVPVLDSPAGRIAVGDADPAVFAWTSPDPEANRFKVELFKEADSLGVQTVEGTTLEWPDPLDPGAYAWRVKPIRALTGFTISGDWSAPQPFQVGVPGPCTITAPEAMAVFPPGTASLPCSWTAADGADSYTLILLHNNTLLATVPGVTATNHTFAMKFQPGYLTLFVEPVNASGLGMPSPARTFLVMRAMTPANGDALNAGRLFSWTRSKTATRYLFKLWKLNAATSQYALVRQDWVAAGTTTPVRWVCPQSFSPGTYRWAITDYKGDSSGFTTTAPFTVP